MGAEVRNEGLHQSAEFWRQDEVGSEAREQGIGQLQMFKTGRVQLLGRHS